MTSSSSFASKAVLVGGLCLAGIGVALVSVRLAVAKITREEATTAVFVKRDRERCTITINGDLSLKTTRDKFLRAYHAHVMYYQGLRASIKPTGGHSKPLGLEMKGDEKKRVERVTRKDTGIQMGSTAFPLDVVLGFGGTTTANLKYFKSLTTMLLLHLGRTTCHLRTAVVDGGAGLIALACDDVVFYDESTIVVPPLVIQHQDDWVSKPSIAPTPTIINLRSANIVEEAALKIYFSLLLIRRGWDPDEQQKAWTGLYRDKSFWTFDVIRSLGINCISR
jgi:hypothetical protein